MATLIQRIQRRLRRPVLRREIAELRKRYRQSPAPLSECLRLQNEAAPILDELDPLAPPMIKQKGSALRDPELAKLLHNEDFGGWSPEIEAMDWLVDWIAAHRPRLVLEFGAGRTTVCWCTILHRLYGQDGFRILSIDQEAENVQRASNRLAALPGRSCCRIVHSPIQTAELEGRPTYFYQLDQVDKSHFAWLGKAEFVFVDGPFGGGPCRYATVPKVLPYLARGAHIIMDDALRDKELFVGSLWEKEGIAVEGVLTLGQGLMLARVA